MASNAVLIPEVVREGPARGCQRTCTYMAGCCGRCPAMGQLPEESAQASLSVDVDAEAWTLGIEQFLDQPSPLFGWPWKWVIAGGAAIWLLRGRK